MTSRTLSPTAEEDVELSPDDVFESTYDSPHYERSLSKADEATLADISDHGSDDSASTMSPRRECACSDTMAWLRWLWRVWWYRDP